MSYTFRDYEFDGPYSQMDEIMDRRGVFVVLCEMGGEWRILDADFASAIRSGILRHPRAFKWKDRCYTNNLAFAAYFMDDRTDGELAAIVAEIVVASEPPCYPAT
jgi:hypothetical protein